MRNITEQTLDNSAPERARFASLPWYKQAGILGGLILGAGVSLVTAATALAEHTERPEVICEWVLEEHTVAIASVYAEKDQLVAPTDPCRKRFDAVVTQIVSRARDAGSDKVHLPSVSSN